MPISTLREAASLSASVLATMALEADQARRAAIRRGDLSGAVEHKRERDALADLSRK